MKLLKRILAVALSAALLCPITAYAAPSQEALALYQQVEAKSKAMTDMNAYYDFQMKMYGSGLEQNGGPGVMDMRMEMNVKMNHMTDPDQMRYMAYCRATLPENQEMTYSMYYLGGYCYIDMLGQKVKTAMPLGEMMKQVSAATGSFNMPPDMIKDLSMWTEGENRVLGYNIDDSSMNEYLQSFMGTTGIGSMTNGTTMNLSNMRCEYVVNPNGDLIKMRLKMDMSMSVAGETIKVNLDGDVGFADIGQPVEIAFPNLAEYKDMSQLLAN